MSQISFFPALSSHTGTRFIVSCILVYGALTLGIANICNGKIDTVSLTASPSDVDSLREVIRSRIDIEGWTRGQSGATCGIYAACRALDLVGVETNPGQYFTYKYVSHAQGSTPSEVVTIVEANGMKAIPLVNLSKLDLMLTDRPVIANVKQSRSVQAFDHWVCVKYQHGKLLVFDGPSGAVDMTFAEFLPLWNGYGIVVTTPSESVFLKLWAIRSCVFLWVVVAGAALWSAWLNKPKTQMRSYLFLGIASLTLAAGGNLIFGDPVRSMRRTDDVARSTHCNLDELRRFVIEGDRVLVDARYPLAYSFGGIPSAVNIPVDISQVALRGLMRDVDRNVPFLIYCQSSQCEYNVVVADKLRLLGFRQVIVSDAGWVEYSAQDTTAEEHRL